MVFSSTDARRDFEVLFTKLYDTNIKDFLDNPTDHYIRTEWIERVRQSEHYDDIYICGGCSRLVVVDNNCKYVFKIQIDKETDVDYGIAEEYIFNEAVKFGISDFFAWSGYVGKYGNAEVYAMEKVDACECKISSEAYSYHLGIARENADFDDDEEPYIDGYDDHDGMLEFACSVNGEGMNKVIDFIIHYGINDLHCGNWGYRNDTLVLIDYGGYGRKVYKD